MVKELLESPPKSTKHQKSHRSHIATAVVLSTALSLALLRIAPSLSFRSDDGRFFLGFAYSIEDSLQYADFVAQARDHNTFFFSNRFTLDKEKARLVILPLYLTGRLAALFGLEVSTAWTIAQASLIILFVLLWYWFVGFFFEDQASRLFAFAFVLLAGGLDGWVVLAADAWPASWAHVLKRDLWVVLGWSPYMTMYNPLYLAGWTVLLPWLILLKKAIEGSLWAALLGAALLPFIYLVHAYDAILAVCTLMLVSIHPLLVKLDFKAFLRVLRTAALISAGIIPMALLAWWQSKDPLFAKVASEGQSGLFVSPDMWLLGFGGIFLAAMYGAQKLGEKTALSGLLFGWLIASAILSFSPLYEGRHFLYFVSLPLGITAVYGLLRLKSMITWNRRNKILLAALFVLVFANSFVRTTVRAFSHPYRDPRMTISKSELTMAKKLRTLPPGGILASRRTCLWLPHLSDHRCVMGHWFLTWDMTRKIAMFKHLVSSRATTQETDALFDEFGARYLFWGPAEAVMGQVPKPEKFRLLPLAKTKDTILFEIRSNAN